MKYGFVIDNRKCIGCHACSTACKSENEVPLGVHRTWVKYTETGQYPDVTRHFQVTRCNHCENPPCVAICPVSAMIQRDDGIVEFDKDACIGCKACIQACPYDAIHIDPESGTAAKCHFCAHRTDIGLEPACVVVCPEHAIVSGDMDDPGSEISKILAKENVTVRKPEQGTRPKLHYIEGHDASMVPTTTAAQKSNFMWAESFAEQPEPRATIAEHMVQVGYNAEHKTYWHWQVPGYILTKNIAAGIFIMAGIFPHLMESGVTGLATALTSLVFTLITTAFLVFDLERPHKFLTILTRPQWRSWLARGAFVLVAFSLLQTAWVGLEWFALAEPAAVIGIRQGILWLGIPLAVLTAIYTAFLFGQAEGRDLWQSSALPLQMLVRAIGCGTAGLWAVVAITGGDVGVLPLLMLAFVGLDVMFTFLGDMLMPHASDVASYAARLLWRGPYRNKVWWGYVAFGRIVPLALMLFSASYWFLVVPLYLVGLFVFEYAFVMAPQKVPNS